MANTPNKLPYDPTTMTVVVIDDQDPIRKAIRRVLQTMKFANVLEYFDGSDAIKALQRSKLPIDLVVTDIYMRNVSGFGVLKRIRAQTYGSDVPVILVTGEGGKEDIVKAVDLGADDYILKPFHVSDIEKKVTTVLTKYHSPPPLLKLLRQGERLMIEEHYADALKLFESATRLDPSSARAQLCKALALDKMGMSQQALDILKESTQKNPTYFKNYATMADIHSRLGNRSQVIEYMKQELELNPKHSARQSLLAGILLNEGDFNGAITHYREALKENAKSKEALLGMGSALDASGNSEKAVYYYRRARRNHPDLTRALELIVKSFEKDGDGQKAIPIILTEIQQFPTQVDARLIAAQLFVRYEQIEKALRTLDEGLSKDPQNVLLLKGKASVLLTADDSANAIELYKQVITLEPTSQNYQFLGLALMQNKQYGPAVQAFQTALKETPERAKILAHIAEVHKKSGNTLEAYFTIKLAKNADSAGLLSNTEADLNELRHNALERRSSNQKPRPPKAS